MQIGPKNQGIVRLWGKFEVIAKFPLNLNPHTAGEEVPVSPPKKGKPYGTEEFTFNKEGWLRRYEATVARRLYKAPLRAAL